MINSCLNYISACGPFTKHTKRTQNFMQDGRLSHIYKNELDKACFQYDMAYSKYKDLEKRTQSDVVLKKEAFKIATDTRKNGYERGLASMVYKFFDKKSKGFELENKELAKLNKPIIRKFKKKSVFFL